MDGSWYLVCMLDAGTMRFECWLIKTSRDHEDGCREPEAKQRGLTLPSCGLNGSLRVLVGTTSVWCTSSSYWFLVVVGGPSPRSRRMQQVSAAVQQKCSYY